MKTLVYFTMILLIAYTGYPQVIEEWVQRYNGPENSWDSAIAIALDTERNVYVTGASFGGATISDIVTIKYNSEGVEQWVQTYDGPANSSDWSIAIAVDISGNVFVVGVSAGLGGTYEIVTLKYNSSGTFLWEQRSNTVTQASSIAVDNSGNVYVTGYLGDWLTIKYNSSGVEQWVRTYDGPIHGTDRINSMAVDDSGNVYITGFVGTTAGGADYGTLKYDTNGNELWVKFYDSGLSKYDEAKSIAVDSNGNVFVTGMSWGNETDLDFATIEYSTNGVELWVQRYDGNGGNDIAEKLTLDNEGNVFVTGVSTYKIPGQSILKQVTIKYSSSGSEQWINIYDGPVPEESAPASISPDNSGNVYIATSNIDLTNSELKDFVTIKYSSSGIEEWVKFYDGPGGSRDRATGIVVDDLENIYVTGISVGNGTSDDYATIKYSQENTIVAWGNSNGGSFGQGTNWVGGTVPDDDQTALFDTSYFETSANHFTSQSYQPLTITFDEITTTKGLRVSRSQIIFDLLQHSYGVDYLSIGGPTPDPIESQLEIINGAVGTTNTLNIAVNGDQGQLIIGSGGILEFNPQEAGALLQIGVGGGCPDGECGRLLIQNGGNLNSNSSGFGSSAIGVDGGGGAVFISGENSKWEDNTLVTVGENDGTGLLHIDNSGQFIGKAMWLAFLDGAHGEITVSDGSSAINLSEKMYIGLGANTEAHFKISNGATGILDKGIEIGGGSGDNDVTVTGFSSGGEPSTLAITDTTFIGTSGSGGMNVLNWGYLLTSTTVIPARQGGVGSALVDGEGSEWRNAGTIRLGFEGVGFINVTDQGVLYTVNLDIGPLGSINGRNVYLGNLPLNSQEEKQLNNKSELLYKLASASIFVDTLLLSSGAQIIADSVIFGEGGYLGSEDTLFFDVVNSGGINPGDSINTPGILTINANYTQLSTGTLFIELEGDLPGSGFDQLEVTDNVQLSGTLDVSALNLFEPFVGQTFEIVTANNITGSFSDIVTHRGLGVDVTYTSNNIIITVTSPVSVDDNDNTIIPTEYSLEPNYPNPFNPTTTIRYSIPQRTNVTLKIYDIIGNEVATLVNEQKPAGTYEVIFDASGLSSGIYFYKMQAGSFVETKKMILLR